MNQGELIPHLFRNEYSKIVAVLSRRFGLAQVEIAEDIASETFLTAANSWGVDGLPKNPVAWLYRVAANKAKNYLHRTQIYEKKITPDLKAGTENYYEQDIDLSPENIIDSQLRMMFVVSHPSISPESQIGLSLRILCGFSIEEIADAFLTNKETINKRLFRAKEKLRELSISMDLPTSEEMGQRLEAVLRTIYLLFNEGYYSVSQDKTIRKELCFEAMRLCNILVENKSTDHPMVKALLALMCFHASRLDARTADDGELILYDEQDTRLWNNELISKGGYFLHASAVGNQFSKYHLEAGIAYWNTQKNNSKEKWESILQLYNQLLQIEYSPMAALNRTYALYMTGEKQTAIEEAEALNLTNNHLYFALLGELYTNTDRKKAKEYFEKALNLVRTKSEQHLIQQKLEKLL